MAVNDRPTLGPMVAALCLQQLRLYTEDLAGRGPILGAGRLRGQAVIDERGLRNTVQDDASLTRLFLDVFGIDGTRLCIVDSVVSDDEGGYQVTVVEGACTYMATTDEPMCVYTLGVFVGAVQAITGRPYQGLETTCQAMGDPACTYEIKRHAALSSS